MWHIVVVTAVCFDVLVLLFIIVLMVVVSVRMSVVVATEDVCESVS